MAKHNIYLEKPIFSMKLAGMQTFDLYSKMNLRAKKKILYVLP